MTPGRALLLVLLAAIWGASFLFIRVAAPAFGPLPLMATRVLIAGAALLAFAAVTRQRLEAGRSRWHYVLLGTLNAAIPFGLIATAELRIGASVASILNATVPLFSVFVARLAYGAPLRAAQVAGAIVGIAGVATLVGVDGLSSDPGYLLAIGASLGASLSYAVGVVYASRVFAGQRPLALALGQQLGAAVVLVPGALLTLPHALPPADAVAALLALALLSTTFAFVIYYRLIAAIGPTRAVVVTFLIPAFGLLFGVVFLGEATGANLFAGMALILAGVALVTGVIGRPRQAELG